MRCYVLTNILICVRTVTNTMWHSWGEVTLELPRIRRIQIRICSLPGSKTRDPDPLRSCLLLNLAQNYEHLKFVLNFFYIMSLVQGTNLIHSFSYTEFGTRYRDFATLKRHFSMVAYCKDSFLLTYISLRIYYNLFFS